MDLHRASGGFCEKFNTLYLNIQILASPAGYAGEIWQY